MDIMPFHPPRNLTPESRSHLLQFVEVSSAEDRIYSHHGWRRGSGIFRERRMKRFEGGLPPFQEILDPRTSSDDHGLDHPGIIESVEGRREGMLDDYFTFNEKISRDYAGSYVEGLEWMLKGKDLSVERYFCWVDYNVDSGFAQWWWMLIKIVFDKLKFL